MVELRDKTLDDLERFVFGRPLESEWQKKYLGHLQDPRRFPRPFSPSWHKSYNVYLKGPDDPPLGTKEWDSESHEAVFCTAELACRLARSFLEDLPRLVGQYGEPAVQQGFDALGSLDTLSYWIHMEAVDPDSKLRVVRAIPAFYAGPAGCRLDLTPWYEEVVGPFSRDPVLRTEFVNVMTSLLEVPAAVTDARHMLGYHFRGEADSVAALAAHGFDPDGNPLNREPEKK